MIALLLAAQLVAAGPRGLIQRLPGWESDDAGVTWRRLDSLPRSGSELTSLVRDANGVLYAASRSTEPYYLGLTTPLRSDDAGASWHPTGGWTQCALGFPYPIRALTVDLAGRNLHAGTEQGVRQASTRRLRPVARAGDTSP